MHTKHCLLRTHVRVNSLTWLAVPARPYYSRSCLLEDYYSSTLDYTTLASPVVWSWVTVETSQQHSFSGTQAYETFENSPW